MLPPQPPNLEISNGEVEDVVPRGIEVVGEVDVSGGVEESIREWPWLLATAAATAAAWSSLVNGGEINARAVLKRYEEARTLQSSSLRPSSRTWLAPASPWRRASELRR
ncbi:hypothetical protein TIFTF001_005349 [Ficus carica]|uniref:Uncharacterized protein n=1 Tax=Ficus carica TaxID=3494 RepID=A0AA87ZNH4_FICCA|nr:hypothetical protein TIFTF001_005349 [Ficus carica]